jgi:hypothetical protein
MQRVESISTDVIFPYISLISAAMPIRCIWLLFMLQLKHAWTTLPFVYYTSKLYCLLNDSILIFFCISSNEYYPLKSDDKLDSCINIFTLRSILTELSGSPCNRPWRPIGLWDVEAPTFSRQSAHRWQWGCQPYASAALYPPGRFLVFIFVRSWVDPRTIMRLEGLRHFKNPNSSVLGPATFRLVA